MIEGDAALLEFEIGAVIALAGRYWLRSFLSIGHGAVALYGLIRVSYFSKGDAIDVAGMDSSLDRG